jgi:predicted O-methyltransferase YrrM
MNQIRPIQELYNNNGYLDLTPGEMRTIAAFVMVNERLKSNPKYLEIGIFGGGTIHFLKNTTKTTQFTGVDLFEDFVVVGDNTHVSGTYRRDDVAKFLGDRVDLVKGDSNKIVPTLTEKYSFIFIDGNHTSDATRKDFLNAQELLAEGGQIGFHNCSAHGEPDWHYVKEDGGPWVVCQELIQSGKWNLVADVDRLKVFTKK